MTTNDKLRKLSHLLWIAIITAIIGGILTIPASIFHVWILTALAAGSVAISLSFYVTVIHQYRKMQRREEEEA